MELSLNLPGEKLVIRLWETVTEKGIGALFRPSLIRRTGRADIDVRREELLMLAQTEQDIKDIQSGRKIVDSDYQLITVDKHASPLEMVYRNQLAQGIQGELNVSRALLSAEADLEGDPQIPPDRKVDDDWLFRWRDAASMVSSGELQSLWGQVLAGEIKSPGSFSLRTLEFLKSISHDEALQIAKLLPFVTYGFIFRGDNKLLNSEGITFEFLLKLQNLGIVSGVSVSGLSTEIMNRYTDEFKVPIVSYNRALMVTHADGSKKIKLPTYGLTSLGEQILKLGSFTPNEIHLRSVGSAICSQGFNVSIGRWDQVTETEGHYVVEEEICANASASSIVSSKPSR